MSEEEIIKQINNIIYDLNAVNEDWYDEDEIETAKYQVKYIQGLLDLYNKKQKQIEQLANGIRVLGTNPDITTEEIIKEFTEKPISEEYMEEFKSRYISKDKVLKAIGYEENDEEYERLKQDDEKLLAILDTLYSEVCRLEDIEDKKVEVAVNFIEERRDKYWEDKIREFFEERLLKYTEADDGIYDKPYLTRGELELVDRYGECKEIAEILLAEKIEIPKESISKDKIREYVNSPEFLDWHLGFTLLDELEYRKNNINELLEEK